MRSDRHSRATHALGVRILLLIAGATLATAAALAHTSLASSTPASGSVLETSPPAIEMTFRAAARLTSVVVVKPDRSQVALEFTPHDSAESFTVKRPQLAPGRNEIRWKALSKDGHVISGTIVLTIE